ncbi:MAG: polymer-forming cytoskeletal protein [bacterium]|jgi:hypothetical protein|nr:polymer-forming cytoskeletal protein [bacterium]
MKKVLFLMSLLGIMLVPATSHASIFRAGDIEALTSEEVIDENIYMAAASIYIDAPVNGDVFVAASSITINADVNGDVFAVGENVVINADVAGDVRTAGGIVQVAGTISGELLIAGGVVQLLPGAVIEGDVRAAGGKVINNAVINGEAFIGAEAFIQNGTVAEGLTVMVSEGWKLGEESTIGGVLDYTAPQSIEIAEGVAGEIIFTQIDIERPEPGELKGVLVGLLSVWVVIKLLAFILAAVAITWYAPKLVKKQSDETLKEFWYHALRGLAIMILVPIIGFLLTMTGIGMVMAWIIFGALSLMMLLAGVHACITFGVWMRSLSYPKGKKKTVDVNELTAILGAVILGGIVLVPFFGWIFVTIWWLASLGAMCIRLQKWLEKNKA